MAIDAITLRYEQIGVRSGGRLRDRAAQMFAWVDPADNSRGWAVLWARLHAVRTDETKPNSGGAGGWAQAGR